MRMRFIMRTVLGIGGAARWIGTEPGHGYRSTSLHRDFVIKTP